jgi:hypothetical protein
VKASTPLAALAVAALLTSGCGGSSDAGTDTTSDGTAADSSAGSADIFVQDDFSDPASGWPKDDGESALIGYADGGYRTLIKAPGGRDARLSFGSPVGAVSVEADATERAGPYSSGQIDEYEFHGVACWGAEAESDRLELGYKFALTPEGHYGILKDDQSGEGLVILAEGDLSVVRYGTTNRIRGDCTAGDGDSTLLVLYVDGRKIAQARDPNGPDRFPAIGLTVGTSEVGTDIFFDNVLARSPRAPRPPTLGPAPEPPPESKGNSPARPPSNLCKRKGIRYSGATAQGGDVCFTVTQDHTRLLEVGFTFVPANRCPEMATGTFYVTGEAGPTVTREQVRSSGFTGTIDGAKAWGVLQDWDICKERTFAWQARRAP